MNTQETQDRQVQIAHWLVLVLILVAAASLRVSNLGGPDLSGDEAWHVFAAKGLQATGVPELPSGYVYGRSLDYTKLVQWSMSLLGDSEASARFPSVIFGVATVAVVYLIGSRLFSPLAGLFAALLLAFSPLDVSWSREVRFYTMFQFLFLLFSISVYLALSHFESFVETKSRKTGYFIAGYILLALVLLLLALRLQILALAGLSGIAAYIVMRALIPIEGARKELVWYRGTGIVILLSAGIVMVLGKEALWPYLEKAMYFTPRWADDSSSNWRYYLYSFLIEYPVVFGGILLSALWWFPKRPRAVLYFLSAFSVPLLLHSFLFAWKHERYILYLLPFLFILSGAGFAAVTRAVFTNTMQFLGARPYATDRRAILAAGLTVVALVFFLAGRPWFSNSLKIPGEEIGGYGVHRSWEAAVHYVMENMDPNDTIVASLPLVAYYYGAPKERLYFMDNYALDPIQEIDLRDASGRLLDYGLGVPVIRDFKEFRVVESIHPCLWVVADRERFFHHPDAIPVEIRKHIQSRYRLHELENAPDMVVWSHREAGGACTNASG